jgi:hypothetical protein
MERLGQRFRPRALVLYRLHISGEDFYPGDSVKLYVNNRKVDQVWADRGGYFAITVEIQLPPGTEPTVTAISHRGGGIVST